MHDLPAHRPAARAAALRRAHVEPRDGTAIESLVDGGWLRDEQFWSSCVVLIEDRPPVAVIDWPVVAKHAYLLEIIRPRQATKLWAIYDATGRSRPSTTDTET